LKLFKSAGVPVTAAVQRLISAGNRARDARDWEAAAAGYREALERDPQLAHVWVQLGHVLKEAGSLGEAEQAYGEALALKVGESDVHLHLGHLKKMTTGLDAAAEHYLLAVELDPSNADAVRELHQIATVGTKISREELVRALRPGAVAAGDGSREINRLKTKLGALVQGRGDDPLSADIELAALSARLDQLAAASPSEDAASSSGTPPLVFDVSDLISYFRNARLPTGIQRVQIEVISAILADPDRPVVKVCCFTDRRDDWLPIAEATFLHLCRLSLLEGGRDDPQWLKTIDLLQVSLNVASPMTFPRGAYLINLGTSWWLQNYFMYVRQAKALWGIRYVPFVHDMIPIMAPEHCTKELTRDFISWAVGAFQHADFFLVNSLATHRDLLEVADTLGHEVKPEQVAVIRLDADFRKPANRPLERHELSRWRLGRGPFVLFVSTVESRKNHLAAFNAWQGLLRSYGARRIPKLVCVGNRGWLNDAVYRRLESNEALREHVVMLSGLSDLELELLYRECLFTLYPSNYEGWGLPVTEALCYGKIPLISDASSLPEAGGVFADYFKAGSVAELTTALERLIFDADYRSARQDEIKVGFQPRPWRSIAAQVEEVVADWAHDGRDSEAEPAGAEDVQLGVYHPLVRNFETRIWPGMKSAEIFRGGSGWWNLDDWGCWTKPVGGRLDLALPKGHGAIRCYMRLHGLPQADSRFQLEVEDGGDFLEGRLRPGEFKWVSLDVPADDGSGLDVKIFLRGADTSNLSDVTGGADARLVGVGLQGFYLCEVEDAVARSNFLECVILDDFERLAYGRRTPAPAGKFVVSPSHNRQAMAPVDA
jgi:glycosyltransferase involved in cell wall biosynthesis